METFRLFCIYNHQRQAYYKVCVYKCLKYFGILFEKKIVKGKSNARRAVYFEKGSRYANENDFRDNLIKQRQ